MKDASDKRNPAAAVATVRNPIKQQRFPLLIVIRPHFLTDAKIIAKVTRRRRFPALNNGKMMKTTPGGKRSLGGAEGLQRQLQANAAER